MNRRKHRTRRAASKEEGLDENPERAPRRTSIFTTTDRGIGSSQILSGRDVSRRKEKFGKKGNPSIGLRCQGQILGRGV
jgi:hypothetical protein